MELSLKIARFLYNIRFRLIILSTIVALLVTYFTQFSQKTYTVSTSIFTGIASQKGLDDNGRIDYLTLSNTFDNVISLTKSKGTLEKVSIKLFATGLMYGDPEKDNLNITAEHYRELIKTTPPEILRLIDKTSLENTVANLTTYKEKIPGNYLYQLFSFTDPHYSYAALREVIVRRINSSDIIEISYSTNDPGIATNTVNFIKEELIISYQDLQYSSTYDVIEYYKKQLEECEGELNSAENELTSYNIENKVINLIDQTKELAASIADFDLRYETALVNYSTSKAMIKELEKQMSVRAQLFSANKEFLNKLSQISSYNEKITEIEIFNKTDSLNNHKKLKYYKELLKKAETDVADVSETINQTQFTKEGIAIGDMVTSWLKETITFEKAKAELKVLENRRAYYYNLQNKYSPISTEIGRREREIHVLEESYLNILHHLQSAHQRLNNIKLTSSTLSTISPATFPLRSDSGKRSIYIFFSFIATALLIIGIQLVIELLDRTIRDSFRAKRMSGLDVISGFTGRKQHIFRGYSRSCNRVSATIITNKLNQLIEQNKTLYVNIFSINKCEGKSYVSNFIKEAWENKGLRVITKEYDKDFTCNNEYYKASSIKYFEEAEYDIVIIEYPPLSESNIPTTFLTESSANILIANGQRVWMTSDNEYVKLVSKYGKKDTIMIINNISRDALEDIIGSLPPYNNENSLVYKIKQLGITSNTNSIKG